MQSTASTQSSLRCPLNEVFASRGQVRLLRVLASEARGPLHASEAAARAGLTESSARRILHRLTRTGLVEQAESGRGHQFTFSSEFPLARAVIRLFEAERDRGKALVQAVREVVRGLAPVPGTVWMQDYLSGWAECQEVAVFNEDGLPESWVGELEEGLVEVEGDFQVDLEVRVYSHSELGEVDWSTVVRVVGAPPKSVTPSAGTSSPGERAGPGNGKLNPSSPEFSGALVALLEENLSVLRRAREKVRGELDQPRNGNGHELWEWQKILDTFSFPRLLNFLGSDSPRAVRLREYSPFPEVLSEEERARLSELASRPG